MTVSRQVVSNMAFSMDTLHRIMLRESSVPHRQTMRRISVVQLAAVPEGQFDYQFNSITHVASCQHCKILKKEGVL